MARHGRTFPIRPHINYQGRIRIYFDRQFSSLLSEEVTLVDVVSRNTTLRTLVESIVLVDVIATTKVQVRAFVESLELVDSVYKMASKVYTEAVTLVDTIAKATNASRTFVEEIVLVDVVSKMPSRLLTESVTLVDTIVKRITNYVIRLPFHKGYVKEESEREGKRID